MVFIAMSHVGVLICWLVGSVMKQKIRCAILSHLNLQSEKQMSSLLQVLNSMIYNDCPTSNTCCKVTKLLSLL